MRTIKTRSVEETINAGAQFARELSSGDVVILSGDLGSGKTHFTKGIAKGSGVKHYERVNSPTFTLVHQIEGDLILYHFDLYRLAVAEELFEIGYEDYLNSGGVLIMEWGDKFCEHLPEQYFLVEFDVLDETTREIKIEKKVRV